MISCLKLPGINRCLFSQQAVSQITVLNTPLYVLNMHYIYVVYVSLNYVLVVSLQTYHVYSTLKRRAFKHTTCIPRWSDVKTTVSTSLQREIHVVCLLALKRPSKIHSGAFEIFNNVPLTPPLSCFVSVLDQSKETDVRYNILSETY